MHEAFDDRVETGLTPSSMMVVGPSTQRSRRSSAPRSRPARMLAVIDTAKVQRRSLRFANIAEARAELSAIVAAQRAGTLKPLGNWSASQNLNHIAAFIEYAFDGFPPEMPTPPWPIRMVLRFLKNKYLKNGLPSGVRIPKVPGGTVGATESSLEEATARLGRAFERLEQTAPTHPSPAFGAMTHAEWTQLNLRHAELHFGFLQR